MNEYIGIDIGGTKIAVVKGNENGTVLKKIRFENDAPYPVILERIIAAAKELGPARAAGISCGGPLDSKRGLIQSPPNLPDWKDVPITQLLGDALGMPVFLQNDADACALAEWRFGAGRGCESMVFLTFGTGLGAGLILGGSLYSGHLGYAGEVGHIAMEKDGPVGHNKAGSWEGFCSGGGLARLATQRARDLIAMGTPPAFCPTADDLDRITAHSVAIAAQAGDPAAKEIYELCGEMLGRGIAILLDILNPERIVIGSIYTRARELLEPSMKKSIQKEALAPNAAACKILPAELGEALGDIAALSVAITGIKGGTKA